jgi:hypothetical protein
MLSWTVAKMDTGRTEARKGRSGTEKREWKTWR